MTDQIFQLRTEQPLRPTEFVQLLLDHGRPGGRVAYLRLSESDNDGTGIYLNRAQLQELVTHGQSLVDSMEDSWGVGHMLDAEVRADQARVRAEQDAARVAKIFERIEAHDNGEAFIDQWDLLPVALRLIEEGKLRNVATNAGNSYVIVAAV